MMVGVRSEHVTAACMSRSDDATDFSHFVGSKHRAMD